MFPVRKLSLAAAQEKNTPWIKPGQIYCRLKKIQLIFGNITMEGQHNNNSTNKHVKRYRDKTNLCVTDMMQIVRWSE